MISAPRLGKIAEGKRPLSGGVQDGGEGTKPEVLYFLGVLKKVARGGAATRAGLEG